MPVLNTYNKAIDDPVLPDEMKGVEVLYKYRAINDRSLNILRSKRIFFSKAADFNDPFDVDTISSDPGQALAGLASCS